NSLGSPGSSLVLAHARILCGDGTVPEREGSCARRTSYLDSPGLRLLLQQPLLTAPIAQQQSFEECIPKWHLGTTETALRYSWSDRRIPFQLLDSASSRREEKLMFYWRFKRCSMSTSRARRPTHLRLECLEARLLPAVIPN